MPKKTFLKPDSAQGGAGGWKKRKEKKKTKNPKPSILQHTQTNGILSTPALGT